MNRTTTPIRLIQPILTNEERLLRWGNVLMPPTTELDAARSARFEHGEKERAHLRLAHIQHEPGYQ